MKLLRQCCLLAVFLLAAGLGSARAQSFAWANLIRGAVDTTFASPQASATDATGNTYVAVSYKDSLRVGSTLLTGPRYQSAALLKYDATGALLWAKGLNYIAGIKLAVDNSAGGIFVTATIGPGTPTWDGVVVPITAPAAFYGKCSAAGTLQWSNRLPKPYYPSMVVAADDIGNAYISGTISPVGGSAVVAGTTVAGSENYFLKVNGAGTAQWVRVLHGTNSNPMYLANVAAKPGGGCVVGGSTANFSVLYLGTGTGTVLLPVRQGSDGFLTSFDTAGAHQWTQLIGTVGYTGQDYARPSAVATDASSNCYVTGFTGGSVPIGGITPTGFYLAKYNAGGVLQWVRSSASQTPGSAGTHVAVGNSGPTVMVESYMNGPNMLNIGTLALRSPNNVVHFNAQGVAQWTVADNWQNGPGATPSYYVPSGLGVDGQDNLYMVGRPSDSFNKFSVIQLGAQTVVGKGTIVARLNAYANTLRGQVYSDLNANGQQDAGEGIFPTPLTGVLTQGSATIYSAVGTDGVLQAYALAGPYTLSLAQLPRFHTVSQPGSGSYSGTFGGSSQLVSGQDFGIAPIPNQADVSVTITPYGVARPGFTTRYRVTVANQGTATSSGTVTLTLDSRATYASSTPTGSRTGQTVTWTYAGLAPYTHLDYDVLFSLPTNTTIGTVLTSTAAAPLAGDLEPSDNTATLPQTVVGSYDPNAIEVNYQRLTPAQVAARQPLDYTIHFQNLGTAYAQHVIISDTLDFTKLNPATLQLVAQSHNCSWSLSSTGPNTGLLTVRFLNINLPERNLDVIRSMGFVRFRVQPRPTLAVGEVIPNQAGIVFDYNDAVITNTATTTVFLASAVLNRREAATWTAYPNPATEAVTLAADLATAGPVRVELLDMLGRPVRQQTLLAPAGPLRQTVDLRGLAAGIYVLRLTPPTGPASSQRVVLR